MKSDSSSYKITSFYFKSNFTSSDLTVIIDKGKIVLGIWQAIYFCEFDGARINRKFYVQFIGK